ncbi:MAG: threonyl-tRNA synthetase editing domain-containing protein [Candidatus Methylarchaceae archaeon HK01B]|nr:threonyl-tRNA synthetase editing domain-containing protein [Candidatus Methylarchaceae archaeon HK01B]
MRVLEIHCSSFSYRIKKSTPVAEDPEPESEDLKDVLVCLVCFEKKDENRLEELIDEFVENIKVDVSRIQCKSVLIYPYAHLSKQLGKPSLAKEFLSELKNRLVEEKIDTHKSPFGWYKAFRLECIGHPLAEAYREF